MSRNPRSRPYLPRHLIEDLKNDPIADFKTSMVHSPDTEQFRLMIISQRNHPHVPVGFPIEPELLASVAFDDDIIPSLSKWEREDHKSNLHLAAVGLDIPMVYECLRMGINPSYKDSCGVTPLYLALEWVRSAILFRKVIHLSTVKYASNTPNAQIIRVQASRIAALLVEQHADIDSGYGDGTPLSVAVELRMWDVVELLLRHGVKVPPLKRLSFATSADKMRYLQLLTAVGEISSRPPRPCPCWSGKLLSECHAADWLPYPEDLLCCCGKNKRYANCCLKREFKWMERWSEKHQMFEVTQDINQVFQPEVPDWITGLPGYSDGVGIIQQGISDLLSKGGDGLREHWHKNNMQQHKAEFFDQFLKPHPDFEPAYSYANGKCDFIPRPWQEQLSKMEGKSRAEEWNALVDEYISTGKDSRPRFDIERVSKIGSHGGPLYRQCEAEECEVYEVRDVEVLRQCSGCKVTVYCSHACQKAHWKVHKKECGVRSQRAQQLPMQWALEKFLMVMPSLASVRGGAMSSEELLTSVIERDMAGICGLASPENMVRSPLNDIFGKLVPGAASTVRSPLTF